MELTEIIRDLDVGRQSVAIKIIYSASEHPVFHGAKVRIQIKSDTYDLQSFARAEIFDVDSVSWKELDFIPFFKMKTPTSLRSRHTELEFREYGVFFEEDILELERRIKLILT